MALVDTLKARLAEAEDAQHKLMIGSMEVEVENGDMRVKYDTTQQKVAQLGQYIASLRAQIVSLGGTLETTQPRRGLVVDLPGCL